MTRADWLVLLPVLIPLSAAGLGVLLSHFPKAQKWIAFAAQIAALICAAQLFLNVFEFSTLEAVWGAWPLPYGIVLRADGLSALMVLMCQIVLFFGFLYALGCKDNCVNNPAFFPLFSGLSVGLTGAMLSADLFHLFVCVELLVLSGAGLTALSDDRNGVEAAYKYFLISLTASMILLVCCGVLYANFGTLNLYQLGAALAVSKPSATVVSTLLLLLVFFFVKSAVVPFHFWQPDFHTAAPTPVHAVLSSVVVKLGVYGILRSLSLLFVLDAPQIDHWILGAGLAGAVLGGLMAAGTYDAKRMLAYSTIGHIGFILTAVALRTQEAWTAAIVYAFHHSLIKAAMLMITGLVASRSPVKGAEFSVIGGLGKTNPAAGVLYFIGGMALAGIPPTNGFISKWLVFNSAIQNEAWIVVGVLCLASMVSIYYVFWAFQRIWWEPMPAGIEPKPYGDKIYAPLILIVMCVLLGFFSDPLIHTAQQISGELMLNGPVAIAGGKAF